MFEIDKILKRSWQILWNYKVLWIFGFLLALTGGGGGSSYSGRFIQSTGRGSNFQTPQWLNSIGTWMETNIGPYFATEQRAIQTMIWIGVAIVAFVIVIGLLYALVRYPAETAVIRMVDENENTGSKQTFKQGWRMGWNRRAFRIWLIDLIINVPILLITLIYLGVIGLSIYRFAQNTGSAAAIGGFIGTILLALLIFIPFVLLFALAGIVRQFIIRFAALEDTGVGESFVRGWNLFKRNLKHALLIWLVMIGIGIAAGFALLIAAIVLIPAYALLAIPGAIVAVIPGAVGYGIASLFSTQMWPWVIAALAALPFFFTIVFAPAYLLSGLVEIYSLNVWTLTFRQLRTMEIPPPPLMVEEAKQPEMGQ